MQSKIPNIGYTLKHDLCTGCGVCQGACPAHAISVMAQNGVFRPVVDTSKCNNSKGCHRCYDSCPGVGIDLIGQAKRLFQDDSIKEDKYIGRYLNCYTGHSNDRDLRFHAASGGCITQFLIWLLKNGKIDGAVVTRFEKNAPLKVKTFLARTGEEILAAKSSKYAPTSMNDIARLLKESEGNRFIVVGVPCQIEGWRKLLAMDSKLRDRVCGLFSVFCSGSRSFYFTEYVMKERRINLDELDFLAYRDNGCLGGMVAKGKNIDFYEDYQSYCHPLRSIFFPRRCILCADHFGELADISFGDIHTPPYNQDKIGINAIIVRNQHWKSLLEEAKVAGVLTLDDLEPATLLASQKMAKVKKSRNIAFGLLLKKAGRAYPDFGTDYGAKVGLKAVLDYAQMRFQQFIGRHKKLWCVIPFLKAKVHIH